MMIFLLPLVKQWGLVFFCVLSKTHTWCMHLCLLLEAGRAGVSGELRASGSGPGREVYSLPPPRTGSLTYTRPCLCTLFPRQL